MSALAHAGHAEGGGLMCGIAGWLGRDAEAKADLAVVRRFAAALVHRGPDGGGFWTGGPMAMAHRRLSIIDLSQAAFQPMTNEDGSVVMLVNGEIYNYQELRRDLEGKGHRFRSRSDSEVVVHLYEEVGARVPELLRGMFALAIYDTRARRLLLARDRFGEKPLYYAQRSDGFVFASELGALLADPATAAEISPEALDTYLTLQYIPAPETIFKGICKLPAGSLLELDCGGEPRARPYYRLQYAPTLAGLDEAEAARRVRAAVEEAVAMRLMSDVPLGAFLSGGIDSSIVVACMARVSSQPVKTFSIGFVGTEFDELPYARQIARRYQTDHHELVVDPDMTALLPSIARHHGEPFGDTSSLPTRYLCEMTRREVTVALSGDGGDEAFGGYRRYRWAALARRLARAPGPLPWLTSALLAALPGAGAHAVRDFARRLRHDEAARYLGLLSHFNHEQRASLYGPALRAVVKTDRALDMLRAHLAAATAQDATNRLCELDTRTYLPDDIFAKVDIASMAHSLEARAPFVDHAVMELGAALPGPFKLRGRVGKYILKKAFADLVPAPIRKRKKKGFASPTHGWFAGPLLGYARELLLSPQARARGLFEPGAVEDLLERNRAGEDHGERLWNLAVLEQWHRELVDGRPAHVQRMATAAEALATASQAS
ncbi:MAG: asparagine synthase (glutamine-hydrolyzing) [Deltaproteobacteria bacterium]|nr:asparagine synthase (glutamine-hydrolyzing) [Deltaproteobacteria bacterium]